MKWTYITAEFGCTRGCTFQSRHDSTLSGPYLCVALVASGVFCLRLAAAPDGLTWTRVLRVVAGELLALFLAGFPLTFVGIATEPRSCRVCGAAMTLRGRHFTSSRRPRRADLALLAIYVAINLVAWTYLEV